jgi:hypothetical protein
VAATRCSACARVCSCRERAAMSLSRHCLHRELSVNTAKPKRASEPRGQPLPCQPHTRAARSHVPSVKRDAVYDDKPHGRVRRQECRQCVHGGRELIAVCGPAHVYVGQQRVRRADGSDLGGHRRVRQPLRERYRKNKTRGRRADMLVCGIVLRA